VRFEPHIITATELLARRLYAIPFALAIIALWALQHAHVIPGKALPLGPMAYLWGGGLVAGVLWAWRAGIRPSYLRLAPGIVQVLQYGLRRTKPVIRSYPLTAGTVIVVSREGKLIKVALGRAGQKDTLSFKHMRRPAEAIEHFWQAVLSTAPIPALSDEELVG
jgi:hypothetical protein